MQRPWNHRRATACSRGFVATIAVTVLASAVITKGMGEAVAGPEPTPITSVLRVSGLAAPVALAFAPGDATRLFICEQLGRVRIYDRVTGMLHTTPFLDIADITRPVGERGLLSIAFDPDYDLNGRFYIAYIDQPNGDMHVVRYTVGADPDVADHDSAVELLAINDYDGHNGGQLQFGPDGHLYFGTGDGTSASSNDEFNNAQNGLSPHGKLLRFDVNAPGTWVPSTNPFVGDPETLDLVWARGLRQPWRFSFDQATGDLYVADVGKSQREEVNFQPAASTGGENYGWKCMEGTLCTPFGGCTCFAQSLTPPVHEVAHGSGPSCAIIGGSVYRGSSIPDLDGQYFYADYCFGWIRSFRLVNGEVTDERDHTTSLNPGFTTTFFSTFGQDPNGELFIASRSGTVWEIMPVSAADCNDNGVADRLDIGAGTSLDCNENGMPDECDVETGSSTDCDGDGVPDECVFGVPVTMASPDMAPLGRSTPQTIVFPAPPDALRNVTISVTASADLGHTHEFLDVHVNGALVGTLFQLIGAECPDNTNEGQVVVPASLFNALLTGGDISVSIVPSVNVSDTACDGTFAQVTLDYETLDPALDSNGNGIADLCECAADTNMDGVVDIADLLLVLGDWGATESPADIDGSGLVDVLDLLGVLESWGPCS